MAATDTALITGSTDGLGREAALRLASRGMHVIVHGRDEERGRAVVGQIAARGVGSAEFHRVDFAALAEVRAFAARVLGEHDRLVLLINNAGIWTEGGDAARRQSADGHELVFAVNYLSGFALTRLLLPLLVKSAPARIVNVSSLAQQAIDFEDVMLTRHYSASRAYSQSKLAQVMFTFDLARELADTGVTANALHPATLMDTTMVRLAGVRPRSTLDEGAAALVHLAAAPELAGRSGLYFNGTREARADPQAYDEAARGRLKALSLELSGLT
jgi:NAD(P)-dependent dehydrogenase (short-subunit alcohol dehydrogenase family)